MGKVLTLAGSVTVEQADGSMPSGSFNELMKLAESLGLTNLVVMPDIVLSADAAYTVTFPAGLTNAHVVFMRSVNGEATAQLTSSKGADQSVPVNPLAIVFSKTTPFTGLKLVRQAGVSVTVRLSFAEKS